jgi:hypothetical protein
MSRASVSIREYALEVQNHPPRSTARMVITSSHASYLPKGSSFPEECCKHPGTNPRVVLPDRKTLSPPAANTGIS